MKEGTSLQTPWIQLCLDKEGVPLEVIQMNLKEASPPPATVPWMSVIVTAELCRAFHKLHVPSFPEFVSDVWSLLPIAQ